MTYLSRAWKSLSRRSLIPLTRSTTARSATAMKRKDLLFSEIYHKDAATNLYMIEIALDQYADIFSEWDPAPFKRRDLDPDLEVYLEGSSEEIPLRYPIELCFTLPAGTRNAQVEEETRSGLNNSFGFRLYFLKKDIKKTNVQTLWYIFLGFLFLWVGTTFPDRLAETVAISLLAEGIFIGGWVFLWEAVSLFFFTNRELYGRYLIYRRLQNALVIFQEAETL